MPYDVFVTHILAIENVASESRVVSPERDDNKSLKAIAAAFRPLVAQRLHAVKAIAR